MPSGGMALWGILMSGVTWHSDREGEGGKGRSPSLLVVSFFLFFVFYFIFMGILWKNWSGTPDL